MTDSAPAPVTDADAAEETKAPEGGLTIVQRPLGEALVQTVSSASPATVLDVHMIDGVPHVRMVEDSRLDDVREVTIHTAALGTVLPDDVDLRHLPCRAGGVHYFVEESGEDEER